MIGDCRGDKYKEYVYVDRTKGNIYTIIEVDSEKGIRVTAIESVASATPRTLREIRLDKELNLQHLLTLK